MRAGVTGAAKQAAIRADGVVQVLRVCAVVSVVASVASPNPLFGTAGVDPLLSKLAGLAQSVVFVVAGLWWLQWFQPLYTAVRNAGRARFGSGRTWFWAWVLPVVNLFLPMRLVRDVWRAADPPGERSPLPAVIRWWWVLWLGAGIFPALSLAFGDLGGRAGAAVAYVVWRLLYVGAAVLAMRTVRILTERVLLLAKQARAETPVPA
jgi:hypothetical protein